MSEFPAFLKLQYQSDGAAERSFLSDIEGMAGRAEKRFAEFSTEARRQLDRATSASRNRGGSLDIGVGDMRAAVQAQEARAVAAREMAQALEALRQKEQDVSQAARLQVASMQAVATEEEAAAAAARRHAAALEQVQGQLNKHSSATRLVVGANIDLAASAERLRSQLDPMYAAQQRFDQELVIAERLLSTGTISTREYAQAQELARQSLQATATTVSGVADAQARLRREEAEAAAAQKQFAASAAQLRAELDPMYAAQQRFDQELARADRLLEAGAISTREYAQAQELARQNLRESSTAIMQQGTAIENVARRGTTAQQNVINSTRASRVAFVQLGQQMQDVTVQAQMGTNAFTIFAQQVPQAAFALSGLEGSVNRTQARIGSFATFLSGPWGAIIFAATAVLGPLAYALIRSGDAADEAAKKNLSLHDALLQAANGSKEATAALEEYNQAQDRARDGADRMIKINLQIAETSLRAAIATREQTQALLDLYQAQASQGPTGLGGQGQIGAQAAASFIGGEVAEQQKGIEALQQSIRNLNIDDARRQAEGAVDPIARINNLYDDMAASAESAAAGNDRLSRSLTETLTGIERQRKSALDAQRESDRLLNRRGGAADSLPPVTMQEVASLIGAPILSGKRSVAQNRKVGGDANSYHLSGTAIDIPLTVNGEPLSKEGIRAALEPAGIAIKELLGPGDKGHNDHFHVAFQRRRVGADQIARQQQRDSERAQREAERQQRELEELARFGDQAAESILRINERFNEQPRLVDQAAQATRALDEVMAELEKRRPSGFEQMIADARDAKTVVQDALVRPFRELEEESARRLEIERLITAGRDDEADALQIIWGLERSLGDLSEERKADILDMVRYENQVLDALERQRTIQDAYIAANREIRGELESFFAGEGADFERIARRLQSRILVEKIFGDALRELDDAARSGFDETVTYLTTETERAATAATNLAIALDQAAYRIANPASMAEIIRGTGGVVGSGSPAANDNGDMIVVTAPRPERDTVGGMTPEKYFNDVGRRLVDPLLAGLEQQIGVKLSGTIKGILGGAAGGYLAAGPVGAILGALQNIPGLGAGAKGAIGGALGGAGTGQMVNGIMRSLGIKGSSTGASIGGAVGSFLPIPGGEIIGAIAGSLFGKLIGGTPRGSATIGAGQVSYSGKGGYRDAATGAAGQVLDSVQSIADRLGASVNSALGRVSIGIRDGNYRVDTSGSGITKTKKGAIDFGEDAEAAARAAMIDLINDGVIAGLTAAENRLLKAGKDIERAVQDVLDFRGVFQRLKAIKDPVGAALDDLNREFDGLADLFKRAGASAAEYAQLEELYGLERAQILKEASERMSSSLRELLSELTTGDMGLSLRDRRAGAVTEYDALAERVRGGDAAAYDDFAQAARTLLSIERELFGSQSGYFERFDEVKAITQGALSEQERLMQQAENRDSPFGPGGVRTDAALIASVDRGNEAIVGELRALNDNFATFGRLMANQQMTVNEGLAFAGTYGNSYF